MVGDLVKAIKGTEGKLGIPHVVPHLSKLILSATSPLCENSSSAIQSAYCSETSASVIWTAIGMCFAEKGPPFMRGWLVLHRPSKNVIHTCFYLSCGLCAILPGCVSKALIFHRLILDASWLNPFTIVLGDSRLHPNPDQRVCSHLIGYPICLFTLPLLFSETVSPNFDCLLSFPLVCEQADAWGNYFVWGNWISFLAFVYFISPISFWVSTPEWQKHCFQVRNHWGSGNWYFFYSSVVWHLLTKSKRWIRAEPLYGIIIY